MIRQQLDFIHEQLQALEKQNIKGLKKRKGIHDPHFPAYIFTRPEKIFIPPKLKRGITGSIDLTKITTKFLKSLSDTKLKKFLDFLSETFLQLKWKDKKKKKD